MTAIASILRQTIRPPNKVLAVCVVDDIATLAAEFTPPRSSQRHKAFDIALETMIEAAKRNNHPELAKFLSLYQTCVDAEVTVNHMTRGEVQDLIDETTHDLEKCAERIGDDFRQEAYAGSDE